MKIISDITELHDYILALKKSGSTISFVPTMGALHKGHLSLVDIARENSDKVIASIFVNPAQFAAGEDFAKYPRDAERDIAMFRQAGVSVVYMPETDLMYPEGFATAISVGKIGKILEGIPRPHFFDGVALVVNKLFNIVMPDFAVFGEKDYQQLVIVKQLVRDFNIPVKIIGGAIIREDDGLAMSSRNIYLNDHERSIAPFLYKTLLNVREKIIKGDKILQSIDWGRDELLNKGFDKIDYLELRDSITLAETGVLENSRLLAAVRLGSTRLLDNLKVI